MRQILINAALFALPFVIWVIYVRLIQRGEISTDGPWLRLIAAGLVLVAISLFVLRFSSDAPADSIYVPPHMEDGKLVKGGHLPPSVEPGP
ncbi:MAG: DUF6111 family protein [Alphaproteobacteria bacterium]